MNVKCPECSHVFPVQTRGKDGGGTKAGENIKKLNKNKMLLSQILYDQNEKKLTIEQVRIIICNNLKLRWKRSDKDFPSGVWDYHNVQVDVSLLVGAGIVSSDQLNQSEFSLDDQTFVAEPIPKYFMSVEQQWRFDEIKQRGGRVHN